jgi:hypothetical protein
MRRDDEYEQDVYGTFGVRAGVVVLGLEVLAESPRAAGVPVVVVAWEPPAGGDERLARIVAGLL